MVVQSVILERRVFKTKKSAREWVRKRKFKSGKIDTTENHYRFRQKEPSLFIKGSFRTTAIHNGVKIIIGKLK